MESFKLDETEKDLKTGECKMLFGYLTRFLKVHKGFMRNGS